MSQKTSIFVYSCFNNHIVVTVKISLTAWVKFQGATFTETPSFCMYSTRFKSNIHFYFGTPFTGIFGIFRERLIVNSIVLYFIAEYPYYKQLLNLKWCWFSLTDEISQSDLFSVPSNCQRTLGRILFLTWCTMSKTDSRLITSVSLLWKHPPCRKNMQVALRGIEEIEPLYSTLRPSASSFMSTSISCFRLETYGTSRNYDRVRSVWD